MAPAPLLRGRRHPSRALLRRLLAGDPEAGDLLRDEYDRQSADWSAWCASQPDYLTPLLDALRRAWPAPPPARVLEVGCGTGQATAALAGRGGCVWASDVSQHMLARLPALPGIKALAADVRALPFATGSLDLIVGLNAVPDAAEFARVVRPGGRVIWVNSFGDRTPLYVPARTLWTHWRAGGGAYARAAHGGWVCLTRD